MDIQVVIADDEPLARQLLVRLVREHGDLTVAGVADNGDTALRMVRETAPDLVFLDIRMPGMTGVELATAFRSLPACPLVVFVTAFDGYATEAFDLEVLDYLVKPVEKQRFVRAVDRARKALCARRVRDLGERIAAVATTHGENPVGNGADPYVIVKQRDELIRIPERDIYWLEARSQYVSIHTKEARSSRFETLRAQINPYFLFNTLNSIASLVESSSSREAYKVIELLAALLRNALDFSRDDVVSLEEELEFLDAYLAIENVRFTDRLRVEKSIPCECLGYRVPALSLQPLQENVVKHAVSATSRPVSVQVEVSCREGRLTIRISDDGPGFPNPIERGVGLDNVHRGSSDWQSAYH
jgi:DNA-binding LytR/AlgR family response regulator